MNISIFSPKRAGKIFCLSMQRTGTTSVGLFFKKFGFKVATYETSVKNNWTSAWYKGDFESIFNSRDFINNQVFEDDPWWCPDFYKVLFHRIPKARFILFTRGSDAWFKSMLSHSGGKTLGNTRIHCKIYRREDEYYNMNKDSSFNSSLEKIDNLLSLDGKEAHYKKIYELYNNEVVEYFTQYSPSSLFNCDLEDEFKWQKLGKFFNIKVPNSFEIHANRSEK